jgi:hypothetical protein
VLTNSVLGESDMGEAEELLHRISNQVGGSVNIISCHILRQELEAVDALEWDAELLQEALEE